MTEESPVEVIVENLESDSMIVVFFKESIREDIGEEPASLEVVLIDFPSDPSIEAKKSSPHTFSIESASKEEEINEVG